MPDYGEILIFLAENPPKLDAERRVHASLLELLGACLRDHDSVVPLLEDEVRNVQNGEQVKPHIH